MVMYACHVRVSGQVLPDVDMSHKFMAYATSLFKGRTPIAVNSCVP